MGASDACVPGISYGIVLRVHDLTFLLYGELDPWFQGAIRKWPTWGPCLARVVIERPAIFALIACGPHLSRLTFPAFGDLFHPTLGPATSQDRPRVRGHWPGRC
jgi:hypothetical protein